LESAIRAEVLATCRSNSDSCSVTWLHASVPAPLAEARGDEEPSCGVVAAQSTRLVAAALIAQTDKTAIQL
jgi:hypothetical protein